MVRAGISTLIGVGRLASVLSHEQLDILVQALMRVISDDGGGAAGLVASHVLVDVGEDTLALGLVVGPDFAGANKTELLSSIPMELEGVLRGEASLRQNAESLKDGDGARGVVVGTGGAVVGALLVDRVEVRSNDNWQIMMVRTVWLSIKGGF